MAVLTAPTAALPTASAGESQSRRRSSRAAAPAGAAAPGRMALHTQAVRGASTVFARRAAPAAARRSVAMHVSADATAQVKIGTRGRRARAPALPDTRRRPPTTSAARSGRVARRSKPDIRSNPGPGVFASLLSPCWPARRRTGQRVPRAAAPPCFSGRGAAAACIARAARRIRRPRAPLATRAHARADSCSPSLALLCALSASPAGALRPRCRPLSRPRR
jgi:hypothetical protein